MWLVWMNAQGVWINRGGRLVSGGGLLTFCLSFSLALNATGVTDDEASFLLPLMPVDDALMAEGGVGVVAGTAVTDEAALFKCFSYS